MTRITSALLLILGAYTLPFAATGAAAETNREVAPAVQDLLARGSEESEPCAALVKECFSYGQAEFTHCLFVSGHHPFCEDKPLGRLVQRRWSMNPGQIKGESGKAFLGPSGVDGECIANFDSRLSALLIGGEIDQEAISSLDETLTQCGTRETPFELLRP